MKKRSLFFFLMLALLSGSAWAQSAYYSYSNISSSYSGSSLYNNGTPTNLLDNSLSSKYCPVYNNDTWPSHSYVDFESNDLIIPTGYVIYTGDDTQQYPGRNPKNWTIQAKVNSNDSWQTIHTVTNAGLPATNKTEVSYSFSNTTAYKYFRFDITAIVNGGIGQLQDFHFIATVQGGSGGGGVTPTCTPSFSSNTDFIASFSLGDINNSSSGFSSGGYGNFTSMSTNLQPGTLISASLTSSSGSGTHAAAVWIDFNDDGTFDSSTERVGTQGSIGASATVNISLSIPSNAAFGRHLMRVVYQYNVTATNITPCPSASYGEGEDYMVNIIAGPASLPYTENFENGQNGWVFVNGTRTNKWYYGAAGAHNGSNGLFISNNGTANEYNVSNASAVWAYKEINFDETKDYVISFDWKAYGESSYDYIRVGLVPSTTTLTDGTTFSTPTGWIDLNNNTYLNQQSSWQTKTTTISVTAGIYKLAFCWRNDNSSGTNPPAAIDNIDVHADTPPITEIYTVADWEAFCTAVNSGRDYSGKTVTLMNDITTAVTTMAGVTTGESTYNYAFKGTFDGQGHTLTVNLTSGTLSGSWYYTAPFRVIDGATIKNLKTTGTVTQNSGKGAAGLAGYTTGTCTITNCVSNVTINSLTSGDGTHGGFFSEIRGTTTMNNCAFTGSITGSNTNYCGGFVGWNNGTATFNNCVFAPTAITFDYTTGNSANFSRNGGTFNNCYYTQTCGTGWTQGKLMHSITGASGITVANAGTATSYTPETSTIVGYGTGIKFNNILYAANNENVSLNLSASTSGIFYADNATITGNSNPYSLAMPNENVVIRLGQGFTITATANPVAGGSVTGGGTFAQGSSCTLTATANTGYSFANWTLNGVVVSTNASYTFTVSEDATYVANFEEWGVFITSTPASTENLTPGTEVVLTASTNVPYSPGLDQYVFNTGNDGSMITPQSWESMIASGKDDAASSLFNMGFTFTYDDVEYTQFSANSNGNLRLGGTVISSGSYSTPFGSSNYTANEPKIIGIGRDLSTGSAGYVRTGLYGSEGSYVRVIEFKLNTGSSASGTTYVMFQVQLFQANNEVRIVYSSDYSNAPSSYQIGIGNADHNKFWYVNPSAHSASYSTTYTSTTYSVYPGARRYYSFTPSTLVYNWTCNSGTAGTANDNVYTVTPTENSSYTVSTTINGQTYTETVEVTMQALTKTIAAYSNSQAEKGGYYLIASPLAAAIAPTDVDGMITDELGSTATQETSTYDLYSFNQAQELEWQNYRASNFNLVNGTGYLYASKNGTTLTFSGAPYSGDTKTVTLSKTEAATGLDFPDWNLVGNPFALDDAYITKSFYTLENSDTYTLNTASTAIHPMQGLLVVADEDGETMTFSTEAPAVNNSKLNMNVSNEHSVVDQAIVSFTEGQQLPKLQFRNGSTKVYMPKDGKEYAIVSTEAMGTMPVNFKAENDGTYTLSFTAEEVSFSYLHLIDNMTGEDVDLLAGASTGSATYTFDAKTTDYESRFKLVFATGNNANDDAFAFYSNGSFVINNEGNATLQVIDVNGRILKSESINGCANVDVKASTGVYVLRLVNGNDVKVQKVVVK